MWISRLAFIVALAGISAVHGQDESTPLPVVPEDPGILPGEIPFGGPGPGEVIAGTYRTSRCIPSVVEGAGGMTLGSQQSPDGCQYRDTLHYLAPFDTPSEDGGNCTGEPIIAAVSDRAVFYPEGEQPWNMSAVAVRDQYTPLTEEGAEVMNAACPQLAPWEVDVPQEAYPDCNSSALVFTYFPCRTFYVLANFIPEAQITEFRAGPDFVRCDPETRTTFEDDDTPSRNLKISNDTTITRGCVVPGYEYPTPPAPTPDESTPLPVVPEDPGILPGEIPFGGPGPGEVIAGTYRTSRCIPSVVEGAGGMTLGSQQSPDGCQYRDTLHYLAPFDTPSEDGGNCTGEPIIAAVSDRAVFYPEGEQPWNMSAVAIRDQYTPLTEEGAEVMNAACPQLSPWEVDVPQEAYPDCNSSALVFTYFPCRTFYVLANFIPEAQITEFRAGPDFVRCDPETRTTFEDDDTPSRNLKISNDTTITRGCVVPGYEYPTPPTMTPPTAPTPETSSASAMSLLGGLVAAVTSMLFAAA